MNSDSQISYWQHFFINCITSIVFLGKGLGGTGIQHGMMYMRANPWDYNQWANFGIEGWSYEEILPYFTVAENNIQIGDIYQSVSFNPTYSRLHL